jgi:hypothetical protein
MSIEKIGLKGKQATEANKHNYAVYVARLKATGEKFPCNQFGTVSIEGVAEQVKCTTKVLQKGSLKTQFKKDVELIGVGVKNNLDSKLPLKDEAKFGEALSSKPLNMNAKERESLKAENERLSQKILQLEMRQKEGELTLNELLRSGRRFML